MEKTVESKGGGGGEALTSPVSLSVHKTKNEQKQKNKMTVKKDDKLDTRIKKILKIKKLSSRQKVELIGKAIVDHNRRNILKARQKLPGAASMLLSGGGGGDRNKNEDENVKRVTYDDNTITRSSMMKHSKNNENNIIT